MDQLWAGGTGDGRFGIVTDPQAHPEQPGPSIEPTSTPSDVLHESQELAGEPEWPSEMPDSSPEVTPDAVASEQPGGAPATPPGGLVACTVATRAQLPAARVLRDSFRSNHPGSGFTIVVLDRPENLGGMERTQYVTPPDIGVDAVEYARLTMACTAEQLRAVLRPRLLGRLLESGSTVLYLEPEVQVFGRFDDVLATLTYQQPVALAPRVLRPLLSDGLRPSAADLADSGTFDPNLIAVAPGSEQFLALWSGQVDADPASAGSFTDGVPALIDHQVLRDPGIGLSVFNAGQRELDETDSRRYLVDGCALRSVHFDGFEPERPWLLSADYADRPRVLLSEHPLLARLCAGYRNALVASGYPHQHEHPFDGLPDGTVIPSELRRAYLREWSRARQESDEDEVVPSPFEDGPDVVERFLAWACEPENRQQRAAGGSRWTAAVWADDASLRRAYPDPFGVDAVSFREWCVGTGVASGRVPDRAVDANTAEAEVGMVDQLGVAVLGSGSLADRVRTAVRASGLPSADTPYYPVVVRCDGSIPVPPGHHVVDVRPDGVAEATAVAPDRVDEIWVLSEASRQATARSVGPTVRVVTLPQSDPGDIGLATRKGARARLDLSDEFVVGAFVDHTDERKGNVLGLVNAFVGAFPDRQDVRMVVAVSGAAESPEAAERLRLATTADARISLLESDDRDTVVTVASDCVASLHRADGGTGGDHYALRLLNVIGRGVPVVAPDHGAVSELIGQHAARLVACQQGGEPDPDSAAAALAGVAGDPEATARFAAEAKQHLLSTSGVSRAGEALRGAVEQSYRRWRTSSGHERDQAEDPLRPLLVARHALHRPPEVGVGGRNAMTPALRKAVLKALGHYDEHIRDIMRSLLDGVEQTAGELLRRQNAVDETAVRGDVERLEQRQNELADQVSGADDGLARVRTDLAEQQRSLREVEERIGDGSSGDDRTDALAERIEHLTGAVERTLDRVDQLEKQWQEQSRTQQERIDQGVRRASGDAEHALRATDAVQRVLLREHERHAGWDDEGSSAPVLCDAGLLRLPADDAQMLPWLSSHITWDTEVSTLIDSLLEPGGVFLDVGSYVGYQSVRVLSRLGTSGAVVAVEPSRVGREYLARNVEVNVTDGAGDRLTVLDKAAWDSSCDLEVVGGPAGGVRITGERRSGEQEAAESSEDAGGSEQGQDDAETVSGVRLDRELEGHPAVSELGLSVVHVDVGTHAHRILGGLVRLLRRDRPSIVCSFTPGAVERMGDDPTAALREFGTWGYDLVPVGRSRPESPEALLEAVGSAGQASTVKLWLRPRESGE